MRANNASASQSPRKHNYSAPRACHIYRVYRVAFPCNYIYCKQEYMQSSMNSRIQRSFINSFHKLWSASAWYFSTGKQNALCILIHSMAFNSFLVVTALAGFIYPMKSQACALLSPLLKDESCPRYFCLRERWALPEDDSAYFEVKTSNGSTIYWLKRNRKVSSDTYLGTQVKHDEYQPK